MNNNELFKVYREIISNIEGIKDNHIDTFTNEIVRRHVSGWCLPVRTYRRYKHILVYKDHLGRHSPYYRHLLEIEDRSNLKAVIRDIYNTIRIRYYLPHSNLYKGD